MIQTRNNGNMQKKTLIEEIRKQHKELLRSLDLLLQDGQLHERFHDVKRYLKSLTAVNFAEELTVYSELDWDDEIDIDDYRAFQSLLDQLADNIYYSGSRNILLKNELHILRYLARIHYHNEGKSLLKFAEWKLTLEESRSLARVFERKYQEAYCGW